MSLKRTFILLTFSTFALANAQTPPKMQICGAAEKEGLLLTSDGWIFDKNELVSKFTDVSISYPYLSQLNQALRTQGTTLVPLVLPTRAMVHPPKAAASKPQLINYNPKQLNQSYNTYINELNRLGIPTPNLLATFRKFDEKRVGNFFFSGDHHLTTSGARTAAVAAAEFIKRLPVYSVLEKTSFVTTPSSVLKQYHDAGKTKAVEQLCGFKLPREDMQMYQTKPKNPSGDALLGDNQPEVVLVGTSQSRTWWNLEGFLRQYLNADLINVNTEAGGVFLSLQDYLLSKDYATRKPRLIIWEFSIEELNLYRGDAPRMEDTSTLQQIIPSVYGECDKPISKLQANLSGSMNIYSGSLKANDTYIYLTLKFSDLSIESINLEIKENSGQTSIIQLRHNTRLSNKENWYVQIPPLKSEISSINLVIPGKTDGTMTASVCRR